MLVFEEAHLGRVLSAYAVYYTQAGTHLASGQDAPMHRAIQRSGAALPPLRCWPEWITITSGYDFRKG